MKMGVEGTKEGGGEDCLWKASSLSYLGGRLETPRTRDNTGSQLCLVWSRHSKTFLDLIWN